MFIASQVMGLFSLIIYIISFQIDNRNKLLNLQIFANIFAVFQYLLLQAYSGMSMFIIAILGNYLFKKSKSIYSLILVLILIFISAIFTNNNLINLLPIIAYTVYCIALWQLKLKLLRIAEIIACILYIIYDLYVLAFVGVISSLIELIFGLIAIYRFDIRKDVKNESTFKISNY